MIESLIGKDSIEENLNSPMISQSPNTNKLMNLDLNLKAKEKSNHFKESIKLFMNMQTKLNDVVDNQNKKDETHKSARNNETKKKSELQIQLQFSPIKSPIDANVNTTKDLNYKQKNSKQEDPFVHSGHLKAEKFII